jgi:hypothetical protein
MTLHIIWSNSYPSTERLTSIRRIIKDKYGSLYPVSDSDGAEKFELTTRRAEFNQQSFEQPGIPALVNSSHAGTACGKTSPLKSILKH